MSGDVCDMSLAMVVFLEVAIALGPDAP